MSNWIHASMAGEKSVGKEPTLNQRDILGNIFVFLVAGALLALVFSFVLIYGRRPRNYGVFSGFHTGVVVNLPRRARGTIQTHPLCGA